MQTTGQSSHCYLPHLPTELVEHIGSYVVATVDPREEKERIDLYQNRTIYDGLLGLRLTCRGLTAKTKDLFAKTYFSDRSFFLYDEWSLKVLQSISAHPVFARSLQKIRLDPEVLIDIYSDGDDDGPFYGEPSDAPDGTLSWCSETFAHRHLELYQQQQKLCESDSIQDCVKSTLMNFQTTGNIPGVYIGDDRSGQPWSHDLSCGFARKCRYLTARPRNISDYVYNLHAVQLIHTAICETQYPVEDLVFGDDSTTVPPSYLATIPIQGWPYAHLKKLDLTISENVWLEPSPTDNQATLETCFANFLRYAPHIEDFALSTDNPADPNRGSEPLFVILLAVLEQLRNQGHTPFRSLRYFRLFGLYVQTKSLLRFLELTGPSLRALHLEHILEHWMTGEKVAEEVMAAAKGRNLELLIETSYDQYSESKRWDDKKVSLRAQSS